VAKGKSAKKKTKQDNAIVRYLRDTRVELRKVHWPTREGAWRLTKVVMGVTLTMTIFLWAVDRLFDWELSGIIDGNAIAIGVVVIAAVVSVVTAVILNRQMT